MHLPVVLLPLVLRLAATDQQAPDDNDVVAGWTAFGVFLLMALAIVFLGWSLTRQFKKVREAREAGVFDDEPTSSDHDSEDSAKRQQPQR